MTPQPLNSLAGIILSLQSGDSVPYSRLSASVRKQAQSLFDTGALVVERKGGGRVVVVKNSIALNGFIAAMYPGGLFATDIEGEGNRTRGVRLHGDSKKTGIMDMEIVVFRAAFPAPPFLTGRHDGLTLSSFILSKKAGASFNGLVATVENHEQFAKFDWEAKGFNAVILTSGRASNRLIEWLASDSMKGAQYTHFGDYDPVGLDEFARMYAKLGERVRLFVPHNIEALFAHSKLKLVTDSGKMLFRLSALRHPDIDRVIRLMQEHGGGLEQESLLL
ncbi:MAG: hypothetical protein HY937_03400 [Nitrosomonadales bacterium]|nr:hypothetical protein [Nitrosomonadales bacterium]